MSIILPKNHPAINHYPDIENICQPLKKHLGVEAFCYHRFYLDGSETMLSNNTAWTENYYKNAPLYHKELLEVTFTGMQYIVWPNESPSPAMRAFREVYNVHNTISLIFKNNKPYCEWFGFASTSYDSVALYKFLNEIDLLERFSRYFTDTASDIVEKCDGNRIILPITIPEDIEKNTTNQANNYRSDFISDTSLKNNNITLKNKSVFITNREMDCLKKLMLGYSAKETALALSLSHRTVEDHIQNAKEKLGCSKRSEIIRLLITQKERMARF